MLDDFDDLVIYDHHDLNPPCTEDEYLQEVFAMKESCMGLYSVRDLVADEIGPVFCAKNDAVAKRMYTDVVARSKYPADYELVFLGRLDMVSGAIMQDAVGFVVVPDALVHQEVSHE